ncbi:hypothetical protein [Streptomyces sp. NRRL F-5126]|uniref:hypothetical protein n=1 Tax=Streptomyces sp. NRRL F-5126 TaxID=1463857 RepID=UPI0004C66F81|nr:hypothetical protein [Streptomyces sp. NRRL F-5126]
MNSPRRRRAPSDLGPELWDLVVDAGDDGMEREKALEYMSPAQFDVAKAWDRDVLCTLNQECFLYALGRYYVTQDVELAILALSREVALLHGRAVRLHVSAIQPLPPQAQNDPRVRIARSALTEIINAVASLRRAGFSIGTAATHAAD